MEYLLITYLVSCIAFAIIIYIQDKEILANKFLFLAISIFWPAILAIYFSVKDE